MTDDEQPKVKRNPPLAWFVITTAVEWLVLGEIVWYYLHDGQETLHGSAWEWAAPLREALHERSAIRSTLNMIRDLPETE